MEARVSRLFLLCGVVASAAFVVLPGNGLVDQTLIFAVAAGAVAALAVGSGRNGVAARGAWLLIALSQLLFLAADIVWWFAATGPDGESAYPSSADAIYLAGYPLLAAGLIGLLRRRGSPRAVGGMLDAAVVTVALGVAAWFALAEPFAHDQTLSLAAQLTSIAYVLADMVLLGGVAALLFVGGRRGHSFWLLSASIVTLLVADGLYTALEAAGAYSAGDPLDALWGVSYALLGAAALHPSIRLVDSRALLDGAALSRRRLATLAAAALVPPLAVLVAPGELEREVLIAIGGSSLLFVLVALRMVELIARTERARRREEQLTHDLHRQEADARLGALVRNSHDVIVVIGEEGRVTYVTPSVERLLGIGPARTIGRDIFARVHREDLPRAHELLTNLQTTAPVEVRLRHEEGFWRTVEVVGVDMRDDATVGGIVFTCRDVTERKELERQLAHQAFHDSLTGLANRALFTDRVEHALTRDSRRRGEVAVLFLDVDDFKTVNDSLGHSVGDELLVALAERVRGCVRPADTCARFGGDEFAILLERVTGAEDAREVAGRVLDALREPLTAGERELFVHGSIGIALTGPGASSAHDLLRDADVAMYRAKSEGKGRVSIFEPAMRTEVVERLELKAELERAIERDELYVDYQPIVELGGGKIEAIEALVRWRHPERGIVSPAGFIPLAEETGLIVRIGSYVLRTACTQAAAWRRAFPSISQLAISVNLSGRQLQDPGLADEVADALAGAGLPAEHLILEITESILMHDTEQTAERLAQLKALGVQLAIDDFGTGYSSLDYLRRMPVDILKISKPFVESLASDTRSGDLASAVLQIGGTLDLVTVAEGIEQREQAERVSALGCALGQGFHFARPVSPPEIAELLAGDVESALAA